MFKTIARHLSFDYVITEPKRCCGFGLAEGENSTGIFGEMMHGFSDVSWGQLYLTDLKLSNFDMTVSYDYDQACFMVIGNTKQCENIILLLIMLLFSAPQTWSNGSCDCSLPPLLVENLDCADEHNYWRARIHCDLRLSSSQVRTEI